MAQYEVTVTVCGGKRIEKTRFFGKMENARKFIHEIKKTKYLDAYIEGTTNLLGQWPLEDDRYGDY